MYIPSWSLPDSRSSLCPSLWVSVKKEFTLRWKLKKGKHKNSVRKKREWVRMGKIERALACSLTQLVFVTVALIGWLASILCAWPLSHSVSSFNALVHIAINWAVAIVRPVLVLVLFPSPFSVFFFIGPSFCRAASWNIELRLMARASAQWTATKVHIMTVEAVTKTHTRRHTQKNVQY